MDVKSRLYSITDSLRLIDTHEHMELTSDGTYPGGDLFDLIKNTFYLWADLISSGMSPNAWDKLEDDDEQKWNIVRKYLPNVVNTGYYHGIIQGLRNLHNLDEMVINDSNWEALNNSIRLAYKDPLWPEKVLRGKTHIDWAINDVDGFSMNRALFLPAIKIDYLISRATKEHHKETFDEYTAFIDSKLVEFKKKGAITLKTVTPYYRGFDYTDVPEAEVKHIFSKNKEFNSSEKKSIEDFTFHFIIRKAIELELPIQIHTGILAWNEVILEHCNPAALNPLFLQYPKCRFILFHGGFPYTEETAALVKAFPNVFLDFCWLPWISESVTKRCLRDWLDLVPNNKLMWGGDAHRAECVHGHWLIAQKAVVEVLTEKVNENHISLESAVQIAKGIFRNNAINIFHLNLPQE
jgi:hypothetical protein